MDPTNRPAPDVLGRRPPAIDLRADPGAVERLNVVLPHLQKAQAFGGITTALELAAELARHYRSVRFCSQVPLGRPGDLFDLAAVAGPGREPLAVSFAGDVPLACHQREIFLCTHWSTVLAWRAYTRAMEAAGFPAPGFYFFIQDFEPDFYPEGETRTDSLDVYRLARPAHAVVNSRELAAFLAKAGYRFAKTYTLLPSIHPELAAFLRARGNRLAKPAPDPLVLLVYGRPGVPRNRFEAAAEGLALFFSAMDPAERRGFVILSAGKPHPDIELAPGAILKSLGKLPAARYAALLEQSHVGLSLMASPHPSYPPLEMALFGLRVVTNRHPCKDLSRTHPRILGVDRPEPAAIARGLALVCEAVRREPLPDTALPSTSSSLLPWRENLRRLGIEPVRAGG